MKIAVCLSGQPRTLQFAAESINNFFSGDHQYDFFCHVWNYNTHKYKEIDIHYSGDQIVDVDLLTEQLQVFKPKYYKIDSKGDSYYKEWGSLFYSMMYSNFLKKKYEVENEFRYDLVVKSRYDLIFNPCKVFNPPETTHPLDLFSLHYDRMPLEYYIPNASDIIFFGSSIGMDAITDIFREAKYTRYVDNACRLDEALFLGPGTNMHMYANKYNLRFRKTDCLEETIYRNECAPMNSVIDYAKIKENHERYYK